MHADSYTVSLAKEVSLLSRFVQTLLVRGRITCLGYTEMETSDGEAIVADVEYENTELVISYLNPKKEPPLIVVSSKKFANIEVTVPGLDAFTITATPIESADLS